MAVKTVKINGKQRRLEYWLRAYGISRRTFRRRVENGWSERDALTTPLKNARQWITINGETQLLAHWLRRYGAASATYYRKRWQGLNPQEALEASRRTNSVPDEDAKYMIELARAGLGTEEIAEKFECGADQVEFAISEGVQNAA